MKRDSSKTVQTAWVAIGNFFSFGFGIISSAILSRYLDVYEYGLYKQIIFIYSTLLIVFTFGIPRAYAVYLPKVSINEGKHVVGKISRILFVLGIILTFILFVGADLIADILNNAALSRLLKLFSIVPLLMIPTMENILVTYKYSYLNTIYVCFSKLLLLICVVLPVILYKPTCEIAIIGFVIASFIISIVGWMLKNIPFKSLVNMSNTTVTFKGIFAFSIPLLFAGIFGILIQTADQFFISRYFGTETFAIYSNGALELPFVSIIVGATSTVLLPFFSKELNKDRGNTEIVCNTVLLKSAKIIYPILIYCWVFATEIMIFLYGEQYASSANFFRISSMVNFANIFTFAPLVIAAGRVKSYAFVMFITSILLYGVDFCLISLFEISPLCLTFISLVCKIISVILMSFLLKKITGFKLLNVIPWKTMIRIILLSSIAGAISFILSKYLPNGSVLTILILSFISYSLLYMFMAYKIIDYTGLFKFIKWK